jgi:hypothetical protein
MLHNNKPIETPQPLAKPAPSAIAQLELIKLVLIHAPRFLVTQNITDPLDRLVLADNMY